MLVYAVDVGTTNTKVVLFDEQLRRLAIASTPAIYDRADDRVEFSAERLFCSVVELIRQCHRDAGTLDLQHAIIALTGQAESLVLVDHQGHSMGPGLSWLDDRATDEATEIGEHFGIDAAFAITGEPAPSATWPAAKLRWLARHDPARLEAASSILMIKDDLIRRFTGTAAAEITTRGFSYFYDVPKRRYWQGMLDLLGVPETKLPDVVAAGSDLGTVSSPVADLLPPATSYRVNAGALDHFCAMVGTGSYRPGVISESAGTVLSLSLLTTDWAFDPGHRVSFHPGIGADDLVLFNGVDCGGIALEWYRREALSGIGYDELERLLQRRTSTSAPLFLPYLTGVNPPDYFVDARGAFLDLDLGHDRIDLAFAVQEGIAHLLRRNVDALASDAIREIVSTGGGAESAFWSSLKADVCGVDVVVPEEPEATCRGAAVLALVTAGRLGSIDDGTRLHRPPIVRHPAHRTAEREGRYRRFEDYLHRLFEA
ncbi:FGGY-family carbohydrate kinase [Microlunatus soli]|uniref:FGGY family of carbohydrate kinases, C-terminal domain n=1 Tax=Microlunatus soli TaxID=630515 RepID=A0A1H1XVP0_9ACTN|nr:FGGY family carbohydrate kinase [Microlunatus soli]SDT12836.1 FGGY family of carbohydrate kinases, C-terminal domain [Microlunatus soli]